MSDIYIPNETHIRILSKRSALLIVPGKRSVLMNPTKFARLRRARPDIKIVIHETGRVVEEC